jgi:hypothetical protein
MDFIQRKCDLLLQKPLFLVLMSPDPSVKKVNIYQATRIMREFKEVEHNLQNKKCAVTIRDIYKDRPPLSMLRN